MINGKSRIVCYTQKTTWQVIMMKTEIALSNSNQMQVPLKTLVLFLLLQRDVSQG